MVIPLKKYIRTVSNDHIKSGEVSDNYFQEDSDVGYIRGLFDRFKANGSDHEILIQVYRGIVGLVNDGKIVIAGKLTDEFEQKHLEVKKEKIDYEKLDIQDIF